MKVHPTDLRVGDVLDSGATVLRAPRVDHVDRGFIEVVIQYSDGAKRLAAWRRGTILEVDNG